MLRPKLLFLLTLFACTAGNSSAQDAVNFRPLQDSLLNLSRKIWKCRDDSTRIFADGLFFRVFDSVLNEPGSFAFPFDSIRDISVLKSEDSKIRLISWNIPLINGKYSYHGFLQTEDGRLFPLTVNPAEPPEWKNSLLSCSEWSGAVYYQLITGHYLKKDYYTLLGWNGHDAASTYKIIDALTLDEKGQPHFGAPFFRTDEGLKNRIVLEYSKNAGLLLKYDYQTYLQPKGKSVRKTKTWMIVSDRLIPSDPSLKGIYRFYVPAGDTYDGYIFRDGLWTLVRDIVVANPAPRAK